MEFSTLHTTMNGHYNWWRLDSGTLVSHWGGLRIVSNWDFSFSNNSMGKKKGAKSGGDFWDEDPELNQQPDTEEFSAEDSPAPETEGSGPQSASAADDFEDDGLLGALKRSKKKKDKKAEEDSANDAATKSQQGPAVKSKKEKEREKKEREKAKKRAAAQRKVTIPPPEPKNAPSSAEPTPEPENDNSKTAASAKSTGKKKKVNPALAAIQKQQAARKAAEEAKQQAEEEEERLAEEEERRIAEEEAAAERAKQLKKEQQRKKKEELKAQGKYLTKKQREQQAQAARFREQMIASGMVVPGLMDKTSSPSKGKAKDRSVTPETSQKSTKSEPTLQTPVDAKQEAKHESVEKSEPQATKVSKAEDKAPEKAEDSDEDAIMDDWEAALSDEGEKTEPSSEPSPASDDKPTKNVEAQASQEGKTEAEASEIPREDWKLLDESRRKEVDAMRAARHNKAMASANTKNLRSPICAILGHVDTGKTKLLDNMRRTNVQQGEAGGITQQIGATYFPIDLIEKKTETMRSHVNVNFNVPGLLIIDTPGHESFSNLRSRGSSLCNIAILVVDIMHGLEPQTLESIRLLRDRRTPFVVALNKIDRLYGWESHPDNNVRDSLEAQPEAVKREFEDRLEKTKVLFAEQGFNSELYYKNRNMSKYVSLVPTSAVTGEGVPDLLYLLLELTQTRMSKQLMYLSQLEATILEVKVIEGLGTTIDVILSNGYLHEGDRIVLCGTNGPICTNVRALLTPQPARELRIKSAYVHHKEVKAALGVKISAPDLEHAVAGSRLLVVGPDEDEEDLMDDVMEDMTGLLDSVDKTGEGVCVQASTLGSLEALLDFLKDMKIPVMSIGLGPVYKRDVMRTSTMLERNKEFAVMLCFDVRIDREAEQYANEHGIRLFTADIIYHLFDAFTAYQKQILEERRRANIHEAVFPSVCHTIQVINKRNPMIVGVDIVEGSLHIGTPLAIVKPDTSTGEKVVYNLGRIQSMEVDHKPKDHLRKGEANAGVAVRLDSTGLTNMPTWGRHIDEKDNIYSLISRKSIDVLKDPAFREQVPREDWLLIKKLKTVFDIK